MEAACGVVVNLFQNGVIPPQGAARSSIAYLDKVGVMLGNAI
jgi:hypothetical protein